MAACAPSERLLGGATTIVMTFKDVDDVLADPASIAITWREPDGTETPYTQASPEVTQVSTGVWEFASPTLDQPGDYWFYAVGTGGGADAAAERKVKVVSPHVSV